MDTGVKLESLAHAVALINGSLDLDKTLQAIMDSVNEAVGAQASSLILLDAQSDNLFFKASTGTRAAQLKKHKIQASKGIAGWVLKNGQSVLVKDALTDPRHDREFAEKINFMASSILAVPIKEGKETVGVLEVLNPIRKAAFDQEDKHFLEILAPHIANALRNAKAFTKLNQETESLRQISVLKQAIIGNHPQILQAQELVRKIAPFDATVLVYGESGTGKELFARAIHENSKRIDGPFVAVNCTAMPEALLESELFGHEKGSFTGALATRMGKFELAQGGTLFLDEIGDMSPAAQAKVLRAIEGKTFQRVGGSKEIQVDTRIVCATNKDLKKEVSAKTFREDLYYRINECSIQLPPLRARKEDIPLLAETFLKDFAGQFKKKVTGISAEAMKLLVAYDWPGNVRQLRNILKSSLIVADGPLLEPMDLPAEIHLKDAKAFIAHGTHASLEEMEKNYILSVLRDTHWNKSNAAKILNVSRPTLNKKIKDFELQR